MVVVALGDVDVVDEQFDVGRTTQYTHEACDSEADQDEHEQVVRG